MSKKRREKGKYRVGSVHRTTHWGDAVVVSNEGKSLTVKFLNSGNIKAGVSRSNLSNGSVADRGSATHVPRTRKRLKDAFAVGSIHPTNNWGDVEIVSSNDKTFTVKFLNSGNVKVGVSYTSLHTGRVMDKVLASHGTGNGLTVMPKRNYVYIARHNGCIVYVGKGVRTRYKHCVNGRSSCYLLNKLHFYGETVTVEIAVDNISSETAAWLEKELIIRYRPEGNILMNS